MRLAKKACGRYQKYEVWTGIGAVGQWADCIIPENDGHPQRTEKPKTGADRYFGNGEQGLNAWQHSKKV